MAASVVFTTRKVQGRSRRAATATRGRTAASSGAWTAGSCTTGMAVSTAAAYWSPSCRSSWTLTAHAAAAMSPSPPARRGRLRRRFFAY
ncbi:MAG: hypothetical protein AUI13_00025 [Gemmatimonadetes bacterium 13_2_20CM_2_69_23]|nr:MAG: hypothetical protein AUI13_00025 [Gemmatimonadetes bacterium 13_2_20CM_2_69_23]